MAGSKRRSSTKLTPLEFSMFRRRPTVKTGEALGDGHRVLLAVSGGADSVALFHILQSLSKRWGFELIAVHVHHGATPDLRQLRFRNRAEKLVLKVAKNLGVAAVVLNPGRDLKVVSQSEEALRELRRHALLTYGDSVGASFVAMAHHADDLFETRLIRLLRGTGPSGFVGMGEISAAGSQRKIQIWRPLLRHTRQEIRTDLNARGLKAALDWISDPSNLSEVYLRGRIRKKLIPTIEKMREGGATSMARSFELLAEMVPDASVPAAVKVPRLKRSDVLKLEPLERRRRLAAWLSRQQIKNFSKAQIEEVIKRIDTPRKRLTFTVGRRVWLVDDQIRLKPSAASDE